MKPRLYYLFLDGCEACTKGKPFLTKFEKRHPEIEVIRIDLMKVKWNHPWSPDATPTYVLEIPGHKRTRYEGWITDKQLEDFVVKSKQMVGAR